MPSKYVTVEGTAVHSFYSGPTTLPTEPPRFDRGHVLLLLHAAGSNAHAWQRQLDRFGEAHSVLACDLPAHGRSGGTEGLPSIAAYADLVGGLMEALDLPACVAVGRSMGAAVALELAARRPTRIKALVLAGAAARFDVSADQLATWKDVMRGRAPQPFTADGYAPGTDFGVLRQAWMEQVKTDPRVRYRDLRACAEFDFSGRVGAVEQPTLVIAGRGDTFAPLSAAEELCRGLRRSRLVVVDGAAGDVPLEKPDEFDAALEAFLDGTPS